ncbi:homocysteine synthase [Desulfatiferula olefinivorans]
MEKTSPYRLATRVIHEAEAPEDWQGATSAPIFQSAAHVHPTAQSLSDTFAGKTDAHIYTRLSNPTNTVLEKKLAALEGGKGAIVMGSGMAAVSNTCMALLRSGDNFVSARSLFMSTYLLFVNVFKKYGITARLVDAADPTDVAAAIDEHTRFVYLETIGNPAMDIPCIRTLSDLAHRHGLPLVVDNTLATPFLLTPIALGADVVLHSTTKFLSGHGNAPGGVVVDGGNFDWSSPRFADFKPFVDRKGPLALLDRIWREHHINFGTTQAPFHSYLTMMGLETFVLRMERHMQNTLSVARFLNDRPEVVSVNYPGLDDHPFHAVADRQFGGRGFGGLLTFDLADEAACFRLIDRLKLVRHLANLGDCKTLIIHPWSTQYVAFDPAVKTALGIRPGMLRLSVGIEDDGDIKDDLAQALERS